MDYTFELIITALALSAYGAIRLLIDFLSLAGNIIAKLANYAKTVDKPLANTPPQASNVLKYTAPKVDKRHKYAVNVEACERYLASKSK